jgi:Holliday junction resolvase-like predicted endonuclease
MARLSPGRQGDIGEFSAMQWLDSQGYKIWLPLGHSPNVDMIAEDDDEQMLRVQVKTSTQWRDRRWMVAICTRGGNRSWSGLVKRFSAERCDWLFVLVGDGRRWFIPADKVGGGGGVLLGGPKYADFEIEPGRPIPSGDLC